MPFYLLVAILILFSACKNPCKDKNCLNGGNCVDGKCQCENPFTGDNCETDACQRVICNNGGHCYLGHCECAEGYEGAQCDTPVTDKFKGTYTGTATSSNGSHPTPNFVITAYGAVAHHEISIASLDTRTAVAVVSGFVINIQSQELPNGDVVSGSGQLDTDKQHLSLNCTITPYGGSAYTINYVVTKQ